VNRPRQTALLMLAGLAAGSWWLAGGHGAAPAVEGGATQAAPGYYLVDATLEQTDAAGRTTLLAHAVRAAQQGDGAGIGLDAPTVRYRTATGREWLMTARQGLLPAGGSVVDLDGDVTLHAEGSGGAVVRTERLQLDVPRQLATTEQPVRIEMPPHELLARGLRADLTQETLRLEAEVHGTFPR
jgi:LPS export ABC transporter protein LptC